MKKLIFILFVCICLLQLVNAEDIYKKGDPIDLKVPFEVDGKIPLPTATCNISIKFSNGTYIADNANMTNQGNGDFNYTIAAGDTSAIGVYRWDAYCCEATKCASGYGTFEVTNTGMELTGVKVAFYIAILFLVIFMFILNMIIIPMLPTKDSTDELGNIMSINKLKYVRPVLYVTAWGLLLSLMFISSNIAFAYMGTELVAKFLFTIYKVMFLVSIPGIFIWFIYILVNIFRDMEMKKMIERGIDIQGP